MKYVIVRHKSGQIYPLIFQDMLLHNTLKFPKDFKIVSAGFCAVLFNIIRVDRTRLGSESLGIKVWDADLDEEYLNKIFESSALHLIRENDYQKAPRYLRKRYTPERIENLETDEIFVFGSSLRGKRVAGAALFAYERGWIGKGTGEGVDKLGKAYALPTLDEDNRKLRPREIQRYLEKFIKYARAHKKQTFLLTKIGCGIAGMTEKTMANVLTKAIRNAGDSRNIIIPKEFDV